MTNQLFEIWAEHAPPHAFWDARAECVDMDPTIFFPGHGESARDARAICHRCPVSEDCLEYALTHHERHGVWGGATYAERKVMSRARRAA